MQHTTHTLERAREFVKSSARPLDQARFAFLEGADAEQVYTELARFQNGDRGFGHGLEPDRQSSDSSVIATTIALQILREVNAPARHPLVNDAMRYLMGTYDADAVRWPMIDPDGDRGTTRALVDL